jgi:two-component SAPR family response regulator
MGTGGLRVIVIEDEALLVLEMEDILGDLGCVVVGTASRLPPAMELAQNADFDVAILDMNIAGQRIDPIAQIIVARQLKIIFVTGYGQRTLPPGVTAPVVDKPCTPEKLRALLGAWEVARRG